MSIKTLPILFSGHMVLAILVGRKIMTRRVVNSLLGFGAITEFNHSDTPGYDWIFRNKRMLWNDISEERLLRCCPYGAVGDLLWVRETTLFWRDDSGPCKVAAYAADGYRLEDGERWTPSIHMPRWASRLTLKVTGVRVERLQDISEEDAKAEGVEPLPGNSDNLANHLASTFGTRHKAAFSFLWDSINGKPRANGQDISWDANPWVWVVEFSPVLANVDKVLFELQQKEKVPLPPVEPSMPKPRECCP